MSVNKASKGRFIDIPERVRIDSRRRVEIWECGRGGCDGRPFLFHGVFRTSSRARRSASWFP